MPALRIRNGNLLKVLAPSLGRDLQGHTHAQGDSKNCWIGANP